MVFLKKANPEDLEKEWLFVRDMPEDENGLTNAYHGISREAFRDRALPEMLSFAEGSSLPEGYVPETFFFLWNGDTIVGQFRIRHWLCESLRTGAGHIGYFISKPFRGKGYGTEGLRLALAEAGRIVPEEEIYLRVNRDNPASLRVILKNGGRVVAENETKVFVRIPNPGKRTYLIQFSVGEPDWNTVPRLEADNILWKPDCGIRASGQFCHDTRYLYVHLRAVEKQIRAEYTAPLSPVCRDSCLEFFFMPEGENRYFNFEINPNGCLHIGFGHGREDSTVLYRKDLRQLLEIRTERTPDGWEAYYRIPLSFLRIFLPDFTFTGALRANVYKCGDLTEREHYLSWNPVFSETPDFHRPRDFGCMKFE